jgi:Tol biopolymer transport system component
MIRGFYSLIAVMLLLFASTSNLNAQEHRKSFGQNRVQYKTFDWQYYSTDNFDILYYAEGHEYAKLALKYLVDEFDKITDLIGYPPYAKTKIFIYNSTTDLQQSNVGVEGATFDIAGQTNFVKLQVEIAYPGSVAEFKKELDFKIAQLLIEDMMFGGSLVEMFQSTYLLNLPAWFVDGAANYMAYGWDVEMDDFMRDFLSGKKVKKLTKYDRDRAAIIGQSIWNFIAVKYGRSNISSVLNLTRIIRNAENSIASSLGIPFKQFKYEWLEYYQNSNNLVADEYINPDTDELIVGKRGKNVAFHHIKISPDGKNIAYSKNYKGKYKIVVREISTGKERNVIKGGSYLVNQVIHDELPHLEWIDSTKIGIVQVEYGFLQLVSYDLESNTKLKKSLKRFNQVKDIGFHENGKLAVISADVRGQNDLYLISMRKNAIKRLTKDQWDDLYPKFVPGTNSIVFSSNRLTDTLEYKTIEINDAPEYYNLFAYDLDTTQNVLQRLTNSISNDTKPLGMDSDNILYLSDQKGINNLFRYNISGRVSNEVSNYNASIQDYDYNTKTGDLSYFMLDKGKTRLFYSKKFDPKTNKFAKQTLRNQINQIEFIRARKEKLLNETNQLQLDTLVIPSQFDSTNYQDDDLFIDTDNYQFEDDSDNEPFSFLSTYSKLEKEPTIVGPDAFESGFTADNVITSFRIDPLRGTGFLMETEMNDVLENHKFYGGFFYTDDLQSGDFFAEYKFLKNRIDLIARYDRKTLLIERTDEFNQPVVHKYKSNTYSVGASLPISVSTRLSVSPFFTSNKFINLNEDHVSNPQQALASSPVQDESLSFAGVKAELIVDNTLSNGLNLFEGTRAKFAFQTYTSINDNSKSFNNITVDFRHYQKIFRELIIASRVYFGKSFGNNPKKYLLGGMDNWIINNTDNQNEQGGPLNFNNQVPNTDILFTEFVNLRGYNYNKFNGNSVLTANAEIRFPIIKVFHRGSIKSNFLRNLQLIGFYDVGSAWTGKSPFSDGNTVNVKKVTPEGSPFEATIKTSRNPWLASYGYGVRTVLFGYYMRFDYSLPIEDFNIGDRKMYFTFGYDF